MNITMDVTHKGLIDANLPALDTIRLFGFPHCSGDVSVQTFSDSVELLSSSDMICNGYSKVNVYVVVVLTYNVPA